MCVCGWMEGVETIINKCGGEGRIIMIIGSWMEIILMAAGGRGEVFGSEGRVIVIIMDCLRD